MELLEHFDANMPHKLPDAVADLYRVFIQQDICPHCQKSLDHSPIYFYRHSAGWKIPGFTGRWWLYLECDYCGTQWSLWKLGVPR